MDNVSVKLVGRLAKSTSRRIVCNVILFSLQLCEMAQGGDIDAAKVLRRSCDNAKALKSVQFTATVRDGEGWVTTVSYATKGSMYRVTKDDHPPVSWKGKTSSERIKNWDGNLTPPREPMHWTAAYNGNRYQGLNHSLKTLLLSNAANGVAPPPIVPCPENLVYIWLRDAADKSSAFSSTDSAAWNARLADGKFIKTVNDVYTIHYIEFPMRSGNYKSFVYSVGFAEQLDYMPIRIKCYSPQENQEMLTCNVEETKTIEIGTKQFIYPAHVVLRQLTLKGISQHQEYDVQVDPKSLRLNEPIDDGLFTIPPSSVAESHVYDVDKIAAATKEAQASYKKLNLAEQPPARWRMYLILANAIAIIGLIIVLWRHRIMSNASQPD
jgi:hypothetical protein